MIITVKDLDKRVRGDYTCADCIEEWDAKKANLESNDPVFGGYLDTYNYWLADFLWLCGCNISITQDWVDGSEKFTVTLPTTEEEYRKNVEEATDYLEERI